MIALDDIEISHIEKASPSHWIIGLNIVLANGDIYSFDQRPYLIRPLETEARLVCVRKARGLGFSETFILKSIHCTSHGVCPQGVQYIFPTETAMREFVQSRFNVVLKRNPLLRSMVQDTDTTYFKRIGESNLFLNGGTLTHKIEGMQATSMAFLSKQIDAGYIDEIDAFEEANDVISRVQTSMKNSRVKSVVAISNPSVSNYGIDKLYQKSNQLHWYRVCRSNCGTLTCADKEFPNLIDRQGCHCLKCGSPLTFRGEWRPDYPDRKDLCGIRSKDWEGYHISDLNGPNDDPYSILEQWQDKSESNQEKVHKFSLGLPYDGNTNSLTLNEIYECCSYYPESERYEGPSAMGVDVGYSSGFHVVIGYRTGMDSYEIIYTDCLENFNDVLMKGWQYGVSNCVCDMQPEVTSAKRFQSEANQGNKRFRVWLCQYNTTSPVNEVVWDDDNCVVKPYRNYIFDMSHSVVVEKKIKLPHRSRKVEEFARQYIQPYKWHDKEKNVFRYLSRSDNDHFRNAMNYFLLAARTSRIISNKTYKRETTKAIHETVRI